MDDAEFSRCCALLGVAPDVTAPQLERVYVQRSFAAIKSGSAEQKAELRAAYEVLAAELRRREAAASTARSDRAPTLREAAPGFPAVDAARPAAVPASAAPAAAASDLGAPTLPASAPAAASPVSAPAWASAAEAAVPAAAKAWSFDPLSFDSRALNLVALPALLGLAWVVNHSPLVGLLRAFHIWIHEFGHATVAWMSGYRALPLPFGWTNVEGEKALFVYFGVLFLLAVLFWAGWRERKVWPMLLALVLAPLQAWMTWRLPEHRYEFWMAWSGIGGEFALSTGLLALFPVHLPDKFRWGLCRYVFGFLGATTLLNVAEFWHKVATFRELIPYGSMIHGDDDAGGDMNVLRLHGWKETDITASYTQLGAACFAVLAVVWLVFALRLDRPIGRALDRVWPE